MSAVTGGGLVRIQVVKAENKGKGFCRLRTGSPIKTPRLAINPPGTSDQVRGNGQTNDGGGTMPDFGEMADKAKDFAGDHDKQSDEALDKAKDFADDKTGNKYDSQIQSGEDKAENYLGVEDQDKDQQNKSNN
jgi:hypothetical protein